ncbi:MAG: VWA domain-containing protein [Calditrichaeota bacterium]|nr:MAG: VWA domain-containing protein [Calditrichota bacterium]
MKSIINRIIKVTVFCLLTAILSTFFSLSNLVAQNPLNVGINRIDATQFPLIESYMTVRNTDGNTVGGLTEDNFEVYEDGTRELPITVVEITDDAEGVSVVLVIDRSTSMLGSRISDAKLAAQHFVSLMNDKDQAAVVSFANTPRLDITFTSDKTALNNAIDQIFAQGGTAVYDALIRAVDEIEPVQGRRAVILMTDGEDKHSIRTLDQSIARAVEVNVPVYTIGLDVGSNEKVELGRIADETGGQFYDSPNSSDLATIYQMISELLHHSYIVSYNTHNPARDGTLRHVDIISNHLTSTGSDTGSYRAPLDIAPFVLTTDDVPVPGREFKLDIEVPTGGNPIFNMHKLDFRIGYDQQFMTLANGAGKIGAGSMWGNPDEYTLDIIPNQAQGYIDITIEKKSGQFPVSGFGDIGFITFLLNTQVPDQQVLNFRYLSLSAYDESGTLLTTETNDLTVQVFGYSIVAVASDEVPSPGKSFTVLIKVPDHSRDLPYTRALNFSLHYDPTYLYLSEPVNSAFQAGGMLGKSGEFNLNPNVNQIAGTIDFELTKSANFTMMSGKGIFVQVTFDVAMVLPDSTQLSFTLQNLAGTDDSGWEIPLIPEDLTLTSYGLIVWPGDTNNNGSVELADVNFLGVNWGVTGPGRKDEPDVMAWTAQFSKRYSVYNAAFADADGSSQVNERDLIPIAINWGKRRDSQHQVLGKTRLTNIQGSPVGDIEVSVREDGNTTGAYRMLIRLISPNPETVRGFTFKVNHNTNGLNLLSAVAGNLWEEDPLVFSYFTANPEEISACIMLKPGAADNIEDGVLAEVLLIASQMPEPEVFEFNRVGLISADGAVTEKAWINTSAVNEKSDLPTEFAVSPAYPNPFNPETQVRFSMPLAGEVTFSIFNTSGQLVRIHNKSVSQAGSYIWRWDGKDNTGNSVASGAYFWQIMAQMRNGDRTVKNQKVTLMK